MTISNYSTRINRASGVFKDHGNWVDGKVLTKHGIVTVYAQGDSLVEKLTTLDFIWKGFRHTRLFRDKRYSERGLVTQARRFADEIVNNA